MPEVYENVEEFGKAIVDVLRPYFKGYNELEEDDAKIIELTERNRDFDIAIMISKSVIHEEVSRVSITIEQKERKVVDRSFYIKKALVIIHGAFKSRYENIFHTYFIDNGSSTVRGNTVNVVFRKGSRWISIDLYD